VNFKEPVTKPLFHFIREAVECRPQLRPHTWAINAIHELFPGKQCYLSPIQLTTTQAGAVMSGGEIQEKIRPSFCRRIRIARREVRNSPAKSVMSASRARCAMGLGYLVAGNGTRQQ
jgi:hypothetical protein